MTDTAGKWQQQYYDNLNLLKAAGRAAFVEIGQLKAEIAAKDAEIARLREAAEPFTFSTYPDKFQSDDGGCTEAIICDEDVQKLRAALSGKEG